MSEKKRDSFEETGSDTGNQGGIIKEFWSFLKFNRKFWLIPLLLVLLMLGALILLGGTAVAPFIYTLF